MAASGAAEDHNISDYDSDTEPLFGATSGATSLQKTVSSSSTIDLFGSDSDTPLEGGGRIDTKKQGLVKRESSAHDISDSDSDRTIDPNQVLPLLSPILVK